jgi:hypothetical protein
MLEGEIDIDTSGVTVTAATADFAESATLAAVTETVDGEGTTEGAVYSPPEEIVPTLEFPPGLPFTLQVTPVFLAPVTVAVNCCF